MNNVAPENTGYVNITTPPRVLTVDERFPVIDDQSEHSTPAKSFSEETTVTVRYVSFWVIDLFVIFR